MYILEGNIGTGKSTLLKLLTKHTKHIKVVQEPVDNWQGQDSGLSLLKNFYENPKRWAFTLEVLTLFSRVKEHLRVQQLEEPNLIMERSIYSGYYCFASNGYKSGFLTEIEWSIYNQWFEFLVTQKCLTPQGLIYLKIDPKIAHERIHKRSRSAEESIPLEYLEQIDFYHEKYLIQKKVSPQLKNIPVKIIDSNEDFEHNPTRLEKVIEEISIFMEQTQTPAKESVVEKTL